MAEALTFKSSHDMQAYKGLFRKLCGAETKETRGCYTRVTRSSAQLVLVCGNAEMSYSWMTDAKPAPFFNAIFHVLFMPGVTFYWVCMVQTFRKITAKTDVAATWYAFIFGLKTTRTMPLHWSSTPIWSGHLSYLSLWLGPRFIFHSKPVGPQASL